MLALGIMLVVLGVFVTGLRAPTAAAVRADWSLRLTTTPCALGAFVARVRVGAAP